MAEIVGLAGIEKVLQQARHALSQGDIERALLLVEACSMHDAQSSDCLDLEIEVHEALLSRGGTDNFWEAGWLQHRLDELRERRVKLNR
jgi:alkyl sulfatase BDS1-like metallo-beta-lactamase superfamily hydrolase